MRLDEGDYLAHYGILRKSGRYPWGSGETPNQRSKSFLDITTEMLKGQGMSESAVAKAFSTKEDPFTVADLRALKSISTNLQKQEQIRTAQALRDKGMGASAIARQMDLNESSVRSLLEPGRKDKLDLLQSTADMLKRQVEEKQFLDVGANVERDLPIGMGDNPARIGISADKFKTALSMLKEEGYGVHDVYIKQVGTGEMTRYKVLAKPGVTKKEVFANRDSIRPISEKSEDGGRNWGDQGFKPPLHIDPKRVAVRYKEEGGADADGVIFVRPGVPDVSLGKSSYAQVRIAVGKDKYLKGMAVYKDGLPDGVDLQFNTNKSDTGNKLDAMKTMNKNKVTDKIELDNPFGAVIQDGGQILGKNGKPTSVMNIVNKEGDWDKWSRNLSSQVLSKQKPELAESQLGLARDRRRQEFEEIKKLTNPQVRKKLLETFASETDSAAVHLKAASLPRQATKVLLPSNKVKPTEIFAPTFRDGESIALIRYPHAGTFEIPILTVNNKTREAKDLVGQSKGGTARDVVVIHPKVAERLSGADFDGDAVVAIPNNRRDIKNSAALDGLKNFDPKAKYAVPLGPKTKEYPDGTPVIKPARKQQEMGDVTNLISDMTIKGAPMHEVARAVRHSMVVIDSEKHNLDFKASARDNSILELKRRYQGVHPKTGQVKGASTLITRASSQDHPLDRKAASTKDRPDLARIAGGTVNRKTGEMVYEPTGKKKPDGEDARFRSKKLAETKDAYTLVSDREEGGKGTRTESIYASHSNELKALANEARKELVATENVKYQPSAKKVYAHEVSTLDAKLDTALKNSPLERQAQVVANKIVAQKRRDDPSMDKDDLRKVKGQALTEARLRTGAGKDRLGSAKAPITDREWEAIQAGAISNHKLDKILANADLEAIRERATPRTNPVMTDAITRRAEQMNASGYTLSEIADHLGIAMSTLTSALGGEE